MRKQKNSKAGGFIQFFNKFNNQNLNKRKRNKENDKELRKSSRKFSKEITKRQPFQVYGGNHMSPDMPRKATRQIQSP